MNPIPVSASTSNDAVCVNIANHHLVSTFRLLNITSQLDMYGIRKRDTCT